MVVDSFLEMYTTLFGWMFYNIIYYALRDTGLLFIPFVGVFILYYRELNRVDSSDRDGGKEVVRSLEDRLIWMVIIFMIMVAPVIQFESTEMQHRPTSLVSRLQADGTIQPLYNHQTAEANFDIMTMDGYPVQVDVPIWWLLASKLFSGINHMITHEIPEKRDLAGLFSRARTSRIKDPELRKEVELFAEQCYSKAASEFWNNKDTYKQLITYTDAINEFGVDDTNYIGSMFFRRQIYGLFRADQPVRPFLYSALRDIEYEPATAPQYGHPTCVEWWEDSMEPQVAAHIGLLLGNQDIIDDAYSLDEAQSRYFGIKNALNNTEINFTGSGYDYAYAYHPSWTRGLSQLSTTANTYADAVMENAKARVIVENAPLVQALVLCGFYTFLIFVFFLGSYDFSVAILATWGFFSLKFLSVCLFIAWWLEQNLIESMFPNLNMLKVAAQSTTGIVGDVSSTTARKIIMLDNLTNFLYVGLPALFLIMCAWGGFRLGGMSHGIAGFGGGSNNSGLRAGLRILSSKITSRSGQVNQK